MDIVDLGPYTSLLLTTVESAASRETIVDEVLDDVTASLGLVDPAEVRRSLVTRGVTEFEPDQPSETAFETGFLHYLERKPPSWYVGDNPAVVDVLHHLLLVARRADHLLVFASEPAAKARIDRSLDAGGTHGLSALRRVPRDVLNAAFVLDFETRTLWLSGIHRRTVVKADSKILAGKDLRSALDPLDDQTYFWSAARCAVALSDAPDQAPTAVGVSARRSRVWAGPSRDWDAFRTRLDALLGRLVRTEQRDQHSDEPLPVLATAIDDLAGLANPYDITVVAPEMLADDPSVSPEHLQMAERLAHGGVLELRPEPTDPRRFTVELSLDEQEIGSFEMKVAGAQNHLRFEVVGTTPEPGQQDLLAEAVAFCSQRDRLSVRYESGHTISGGAAYHMRFRDVRFESWAFADLSGFKVKKEKPGVGNAFAIDDIGANGERSLFSWVQRNWSQLLDGDAARQRGYLVSDDGAGEIADFIHYDFARPDAPPLLTLIHVKASKSDAPGRGISTSDYEVVIGQAIKNLRSLDRTNLADRLEAGMNKAVASAVWLDGAHLGNRQSMVDRLRDDGERFVRRVVVVQPRVTERSLDAARQGLAGFEVLNRMRQLDTLLVGAEADCRDLGATFHVIGAL